MAELQETHTYVLTLSAEELETLREALRLGWNAADLPLADKIAELQAVI